MYMLRLSMIILLSSVCGFFFLNGKRMQPYEQEKWPLKFSIRTIDGKMMANVMFSIAASKTDLEANRFMDSKRTDADGKVDFGRYNPGVYYYEFDVFEGLTLHSEDSVSIRPGEDKWQEIILDNPNKK